MEISIDTNDGEIQILISETDGEYTESEILSDMINDGENMNMNSEMITDMNNDGEEKTMPDDGEIIQTDMMMEEQSDMT